MAAGALAAGAGAAQGLDEILQRALVEAKMKQLADQTNTAQAETTRSHMAEEGLRGRQIDEMAKDRGARERETAATHRDAEASRVRDDGRALAETIPGDTRLLNDDPAVPQLKAGGARLTGFSSLPSTSSVGASTLPGDESPEGVTVTSAEKPQPVGVIKGFTSAQSEKVTADKRLADDATERGRHNRKMEDRPTAPQISILPTDDGFVRVPKAGGAATPVTGVGGSPVMPKSPAQVINRQSMAGDVGSHFEKTLQQLDEADKRGLLGPLKGRTMTEFMAGKVGTTGNAESDELLGRLRMNLGMLSTGVASLHGRAGANAGIAKEIQRKMDEGYMDPALIRGGLTSLKEWADRYAGDGKKSGGDSKKVTRYDMDGNVIKEQ